MALKYTKAIRNGKLKATEMGTGESVAGILKGFKENNYGTVNVIIEVNGKDVEIFSAGNLKFLAEKVDRGQLALGTHTTITRNENGTTKNGYSVSNFDVTQGQNSPVQTLAGSGTTQTAGSNSTVKDKLEEIRNKRTSN